MDDTKKVFMPTNNTLYPIFKMFSFHFDRFSDTYSLKMPFKAKKTPTLFLSTSQPFIIL